MGNYIMLGDKRIELSDELAASLRVAVQAAESEETGPLARALIGDSYFYIDAHGGVEATTEELATFDSHCFSVANYCTDDELMQQRALHETLNRLLWRYSEQHGGDREWGSVAVSHYAIYYDKLTNGWKTECAGLWKRPGVVYFRDEQTAQKAIEEIVEPFVLDHPEFRW